MNFFWFLQASNANQNTKYAIDKHEISILSKRSNLLKKTPNSTTHIVALSTHEIYKVGREVFIVMSSEEKKSKQVFLIKFMQIDANYSNHVLVLY